MGFVHKRRQCTEKLFLNNILTWKGSQDEVNKIDVDLDFIKIVSISFFDSNKQIHNKWKTNCFKKF